MKWGEILGTTVACTRVQVFGIIRRLTVKGVLQLWAKTQLSHCDVLFHSISPSVNTTMSSNRTQSKSSVLVPPSSHAWCPAVNPLLLCRKVSLLCCTTESNMSLLGTNDLDRCDAIPNILNICISHPDAWTGAVWSEFDECVSWSLAFLLVGKRAAGRHQRVGVCRDSVGLIRSWDSKRKYRFEIRQGGFIHTQSSDSFHVLWWNSEMDIIFTRGTIITSTRGRAAAGAAGSAGTQLREWEDESEADTWPVTTCETALFFYRLARRGEHHRLWHIEPQPSVGWHVQTAELYNVQFVIAG